MGEWIVYVEVIAVYVGIPALFLIAAFFLGRMYEWTKWDEYDREGN